MTIYKHRFTSRLDKSNAQFTFFGLPSNQNGPAFDRVTTKAIKKKPITKITLTLGLIELLISIILFEGFIEPHENSQMYIVWYRIVGGYVNLITLSD